MPRRKNRDKGAFKTTLAGAIKNVQGSLRLFASDSGKPLEALVISSNVSLGVDNPPDPGVAVWFTWDGLQVCIPVDRYTTVASNLQAIHHIIEARRVELRHGTLALVRATFTGFMALPAPGAKRHWMEVLDFFPNDRPQITRQVIEDRFKRLAKQRHPDALGGSHDEFTELQRAKEEALREIGQ
jgi:hypothetical protein